MTVFGNKVLRTYVIVLLTWLMWYQVQCHVRGHTGAGGIKIKGEYIGDLYICTSHNYPLIMSFNVEEMPFSYTNFQKISLPWEGGHPSPTPSPCSVASLPRFDPPYWKILATPLLISHYFILFDSIWLQICTSKMTCYDYKEIGKYG